MASDHIDKHREMADTIATQYIDWDDPKSVKEGAQLQYEIQTALLAAEQRGREAERKRIKVLEAVAEAALEAVHQRDAIMEAGLAGDMAGMDQLIADGKEIHPHLRTTLRAAGHAVPWIDT
jgi:hypothetical protein